MQWTFAPANIVAVLNLAGLAVQSLGTIHAIYMLIAALQRSLWHLRKLLRMHWFSSSHGEKIVQG